MIFLRSKLSGYYLKRPGVWTADPAEAMPFINEWVAREFARREHVEDVQAAEFDSSSGCNFNAAA